MVGTSIRMRRQWHERANVGRERKKKESEWLIRSVGKEKGPRGREEEVASGRRKETAACV